VTYEFKCLSFGLSSAQTAGPTSDTLSEISRNENCHLFGWLRTYADREQGRTNALSTLNDHPAGTTSTINALKSSLQPARLITYLRVVVNSITMKFLLIKEKIQQTTDICKQVLSVESTWAQDLSGKLVAALSAILPAPISSTTANPSPQSIALIPGSASMVNTQSPQMEQKGHSNDSTIQSNASLQGWGAVYNGTRTGGYWSAEEKHQHINSLELQAGMFAVQTWDTYLENCHSLLMALTGLLNYMP